MSRNEMKRMPGLFAVFMRYLVAFHEDIIYIDNVICGASSVQFSTNLINHSLI